MTERGGPSKRGFTAATWLFATALVVLIALGAWWSVYFQRALERELDFEREGLRRTAGLYAAQLMVSRTAVGPSAMPGDERFEIRAIVGAIPPLAYPFGRNSGADGHEDTPLVVAPTQATVDALHDGYSRKRRMLFGEATLLFVLLAVVVAMLYRLVRSERRFRDETEAFLGRVTHEMKTPLAGIKAVLQTIELGRMPGDQQREMVRSALREVDREEHLIQNLILAQRIRAQSSPLATDHVDLAELLRQFHGHRQPFVETSGGVLELEAGEGLAVRGDAPAVRTILDNLVDNAQKYGATRITIRALPDGDTVRVEVVDDGMGFDPTRAESLFRPFVRSRDERAAARQGTGLGLSISRSLAHGMGGSLRADSGGEGQGATFELRLPAMQTDGGK